MESITADAQNFTSPGRFATFWIGCTSPLLADRRSNALQRADPGHPLPLFLDGIILPLKGFSRQK